MREARRLHQLLLLDFTVDTTLVGTSIDQVFMAGVSSCTANKATSAINLSRGELRDGEGQGEYCRYSKCIDRDDVVT